MRDAGLLLEAVDDAERDREDVLHGSADFHAGLVVGGLDGVVVGANCARVLDGDVEVLAPEDGRGGFPRGALVRLHGTRDSDDRRQVVVALVRRDAPDRVGQRHFHDLLDADGGHGNDDGIRARQGLVEFGGTVEGDALRERLVSARVIFASLDCVEEVIVEPRSPQPHVPAGVRERRANGRAHRSGAKDGNGRHCFSLRFLDFCLRRFGLRRGGLAGELVEVLEDVLQLRVERALDCGDVAVLLVLLHVGFDCFAVLRHLLSGGGDVMLAVDARRGHGEDRCTERGDLVLGAHSDGQGGGVRHDLAPQEGARAATHRAQSGEPHTGARLDRVEVVAHFESDGFEDGAVHVGARVGAAPADDGASGDGVPVGDWTAFQ